jgi:hypothetical protein
MPANRPNFVQVAWTPVKDAYAFHHNLTTLLNRIFVSSLQLKCIHYTDFCIIIIIIIIIIIN